MRLSGGLGKTEVWMNNLVRRPFFQERVVSILRERNRDALKSMFKIQRFCIRRRWLSFVMVPRSWW